MQYYSHSLISSFIYIACCREGNMYFISGEFCSRDLHCSSELCTMLWNFLSQILLMIQVYKVHRKCKSALQICTAILNHDFVNFSVKVRWQRRTEGSRQGMPLMRRKVKKLTWVMQRGQHPHGHRRDLVQVGVGRKRWSRKEEEMTNYKSAAATKQVFWQVNQQGGL